MIVKFSTSAIMQTMDFVTFAKETKPLISEALLAYLTSQPMLTKVSPWGEDLRGRLKKFITQGKMLRGTLVILGNKMFGGNGDQAVPAAASLELFHTSFLIHDDIMDQDELRRGLKTFFKQYQNLSQKQGLSNFLHTGESLGICAGDIGFFLGFNLLNTVVVDSEIKQELTQKICNELVLVCLGQMQDVALGANNTLPTEEEILNVYRYKTARYTFSLPLMVGAMLAGAKEEDLQNIEKAGVALGLIFQIKDDELGIFGTEKEIGKPIGSDIREGKKTLYYLYLLQLADVSQKNLLTRIFGNKDLQAEDIIFVQKIILELGIKEKIRQRIADLSREYTAAYESINIAKEYKNLLQGLFEYTIKRTS